MKKFRDWINENIKFDDNDPNSMYVKYHNTETGEKGHVLRGHQKSVAGEVKNNTNTVDNEEKLKNFSVSKEPKNGDRAYSIYHGQTYIGMLAFEKLDSRKEKMDNSVNSGPFNSGVDHPPHLMGAIGHRVLQGALVFPPLNGIKNPGNKQVLTVGYEGPVVYDAKAGMFYAPADSD